MGPFSNAMLPPIRLCAAVLSVCSDVVLCLALPFAWLDASHLHVVLPGRVSSSGSSDKQVLDLGSLLSKFQHFRLSFRARDPALLSRSSLPLPTHTLQYSMRYSTEHCTRRPTIVNCFPMFYHSSSYSRFIDWPSVYVI